MISNDILGQKKKQKTPGILNMRHHTTEEETTVNWK